MSMTRRTLLRSSAPAALGLVAPFGRRLADAAYRADTTIQLARHATLIVRYGGKALLVDPMLSDAGAMPATRWMWKTS